jgi:ribonuclease P protein component
LVYTAEVAEELSTIRKRADFLAANRGIRVAKPGFVLLAHPNQGLGKRFGITVTKKIGNAVVRNRIKRRFRELLRATLPESGLADHDHVLIGREGGIGRDFATMRGELAAALVRAAAGKGDPPRRRSNPGKAHGRGR